MALFAFFVNVIYTPFFEYGATPENKSMIWESWIGQVAVLFFIPVMATFPAACSYFEEKRRNCTGLIQIRSGRKQYYFCKLFAVMISGFAVSTLPFLLNYMFCLIAIPRPDCPTVDTIQHLQGVYQKGDVLGTWRILFPSLFLNHPVLYVLVHIALTGIWGMNIAAVSYAISLYFRKNIVITAALPAVVIMVLSLIAVEMHKIRWVMAIQLMCMPDQNRSPEDLPAVIVLLVLPLVFSLILIIVKLKTKSGRDEL